MPGYRPVQDPVSENLQDNYWNYPPWAAHLFNNVGPARNAPREMPFVEWDPQQRVWHQGPITKRNFRPKYYFTRPHDGKRPGWGGRVKDAFTGEGADVFVTISGDKRTLMRDRPQRWQWTNWMFSEDVANIISDKEFRMQDLEPVIETKYGGSRWKKPYYNFRNREHESAYKTYRHPDKMWTGTQWPRGARHNDRNPWSKRDATGQWFSAVPWWAGAWPGGRPKE